MMPRRGAVAACVLVLVTGLGSALLADYRDSFRRGYQAIERRQWQEAERLLREALSEQPREGGERIRITGSFVRDYFPHFYLGVSLFNQGRVREARAAWDESGRQGAVRGAPEARQLTEYLSRPEVVASRADEPGAGPAGQAVASEAPPRPVDRAAMNSLSPAPGGVGDTTAAERRNDGPEAKAVTVAIPTELRAAARAHFSARYTDAVALLSTASYADARLQVHAHLIRAAARYAMYALDGERDTRLRQLAMEDVLTCRSVAPAFRPDTDVFSPRFRRFFEDAQAGTR